jgi:beta-aspartyl-peptidase (threonine type)
MKAHKENNQPLAIIAHGGAWEIPGDMQDDALEGCSRAAAVGWEVLNEGGTALQAVEAAVRVLEDDPTFDAGRGAVLNAVGEIELDAIVMDGRTLNLGAAMAVKHVRHPVTLARLIKDASEHAVLAADGAELFARSQGLPFCPSWELIVEREVNRWREFAAGGPEGRGLFDKEGDPQGSCDTVGAVALDGLGNLAVATSTGGTAHKHPGRVGDSPLVGSGAYADNRTGAVSATGDGEHLMKIVISKAACDFLDQGMTAQEAADAAIALLEERTEGHGGLVVLDRCGNVGAAHNTGYLAHAYVVEGRTDRGIQV